jgi:hypothetical protein
VVAVSLLLPAERPVKGSSEGGFIATHVLPEVRHHFRGDFDTVIYAYPIGL